MRGNVKELAAGLRWLFETEQPDGAIISHHGVTLGTDDNRRFIFVPAGWKGHAIVAVEVAHVTHRDDQQGAENPLEPDELKDLAAHIAHMGFEVDHTWNGHPATTGSIALKRPVHPSLFAALQRYRAGCPEHPRKGVFCNCGWHSQGRALVVLPAPEDA